MIEQQPDEQAILARCLRDKPASSFTADALSRKAHWRWNRDQHLEAAALFAAADRVARTSGGRAAREAFNYRVRAGINFAKAGRLERAWPILEEAVVFDWHAAGLEMDSHMTEWAFVEMLAAHREAGDVDQFVAVFRRAVRRCEQLPRSFPSIYPQQDALLAWCAELNLPDLFAEVEARATADRGNSRKLKHLIRQLKEQMA